MKRAAAALALLLVAMFVFGPRASLDPFAERALPREVPTEPAALERFVEGTQKKLPDLVPGTEARIVWQRPTKTPTYWSVVALHGFSASRQETAPYAEEVARALDANLYEARFEGHGRSGEALAEATAEDWIRDAREAFAIGAALGERVAVLGVSTGATLATLAALDTDKAPRPSAFVFLSPNFGPKDPSARLLLWPWAENWLPLVVGQERAWEPTNEDHGRYWTERYPTRALFPMMASVQAASSGAVDSISVPTLAFISEADPIVSPAATREVLSRWGGPHEIRTVSGPGGRHVLAGRILSGTRTSTLAQDTARWLEGTRS